MIKFILHTFLCTIAVILLAGSLLLIEPVQRKTFSKVNELLNERLQVSISVDDWSYAFPFEWRASSIQIHPIDPSLPKAHFSFGELLFSFEKGFSLTLVGGELSYEKLKASHQMTYLILNHESDSVNIWANSQVKVNDLPAELNFALNGTQALWKARFLPFHIEGSMDMSASSWKDYQLMASLKGNGPVEKLTPYLNGSFKVDVQAFGPLEKLKWKGSGELLHATLDDEIFEIPLDQMNASFLLEEQTLKITSFKARSQEGFIAGDGLVLLSLKEHLPYRFSLHLNQMALLEEDFVHGIFTGTLQLNGTQKEATLSGELKADSFFLSLAEELPSNIDAVDLTYINGEPPEEISKDLPIHLALWVHLPEYSKVEDRNLRSRWKGSVEIKGTGKTPELFGNIKMVEGNYRFNGKNFTIEEGEVSFAGPLDKKSSLYLKASYELDELTAYVILKGPLSNPLITFRSNPSKTQREILSYLLFNRGINELSPVEGVELSESLSALSKQSPPSNPLDKVKSNLGLDRIEFSRLGEAEDNQLSLQLGKYLANGFFVHFDKSITTDSNKIGLEAH